MLATELAAYPPSMFDAEGQMRVATKSTLKKMFQVEVSQRLTIIPTAIVMDVSAVLWTVDWPSHANVETFISGFKVLFVCLKLMYISVSIDIEITPRRAALDLHELLTPLSTSSILKRRCQPEMLCSRIEPTRHS